MYKDIIVLASSSPRRIEMMQQNGIDPVIISPEVDETLPEGLDMKQSVMYLALKKALYAESFIPDNKSNDVSFCCENRYNAGNTIIIAADTVVYADRVIGKPGDINDAYEILSFLRNRMHYVATGVAVIKAGTPERKIFCEITEVHFKDYSDKDIYEYIATDEPYDKAGGYAIQGTWGKYTDHIVGDLNNVIGFPWDRIKSEIHRIKSAYTLR